MSWLRRYCCNAFYKMAQSVLEQDTAIDVGTLKNFFEATLEIDDEYMQNFYFVQNGSQTLDPRAARNVLAGAIAQAVQEDPHFQSFLRRISNDIAQQNEPYIGINYDTSGPNPQMSVTYQGEQIIAGHAIEERLSAQGIEVVTPSRGERNRVQQRQTTEENRGQIEQEQADNLQQRLQLAEEDNVMRYANHAGYLVNNASLYLDVPQLREYQDEEGNPAKRRGRIRNQDKDKWYMSRQTVIKLTGDMDEGFLFGQVMDERGTPAFADLAGLKRVSKGNSLQIYQKDFAIRLVEYLGLDMQIDMTERMVGTPSESIKLPQYAGHVLESLKRAAPDRATEIEEYFNLGAQGQLV